MDENTERRVDIASLASRVEVLTKLFDQLAYDVRWNNRLIIIAICLIAAGKEILQIVKVG